MGKHGKPFRVLALAISCCGLYPAAAAAAETKAGGGEIALGPLPTFGDEGTARAACEPDAVIWADRGTGYYYPKFMPEYGKSPYGAFSCYQAARRADYWGFGTGDAMSSRRPGLLACSGSTNML